MARKAVATAESVSQAVEALIGEGLDPTVERVRAKLGGGSFTTISKALSGVLSQRQRQATQISEVPGDLVEIGQRAVAAIYAAVQRQASAKVELIEADARKQIDSANHARAEAALEIERLEREAEQGADALTGAQKAAHDALARAERAEATATALQTQLQSARQEIERSREGERRARDEAAELRGQLKTARAQKGKP
jgi:chromosome segregation ATPase